MGKPNAQARAAIAKRRKEGQAKKGGLPLAWGAAAIALLVIVAAVLLPMPEWCVVSHVNY